MKRIDFIGANGSGKSTVYNQLLRRRKGHKSSWLTPMEAKRKLATRRFLNERSLTSFAKAATCYMPRINNVFIDLITMRAAERAFATGDGAYQAFFEHCLQHLAISALDDAPIEALEFSSQTASKHYVSLAWLFSHISELCLLSSLEQTILFDESLSHNTSSILADLGDYNFAREHFEKMPLPSILIHLTASETEILRRLDNRRQSTGVELSRHVGLNRQELRKRTRRALSVAELGASTLQWRGVPVLSLDATADAEENVAKVETLLQEQI